MNKMTAHSEKVEEASMEKLFDCLHKFYPDDKISNINYYQRLQHTGGFISSLTFELTFPKTEYIISTNERHLKCGPVELPKILGRHLKEWRMHDEDAYLVCKYDIRLHNAEEVITSIEEEIRDKYNKDFDVEIDKTLKSE